MEKKKWKPYIYSIFVLSFLFSFYKKYYSSPYDEIDTFLVVKEYIKQSILLLSSTIMENKKIKIFPCLSSTSKEQLDSKINVMSKGLSHALRNFVRKDEVIHTIEQTIQSEHVNLFLLPDTLLEKVKEDHYYTFLVENVSDIMGAKLEKQNVTNSKLYVENLLS
jgi:hypothetical protein